MIVVMQQWATELELQAVIDRMIEMGFDVHRSTGIIHTVLGGVGGRDDVDLEAFLVMDGVKEAHRIAAPYKLASRGFRPGGTVVQLGSLEIGGPAVAVVAGPCSVESQEQMERAAELIARAGARVLRGAVSQLRHSPYAARGMGEEALRLLREAADRNGLLAAAEVADHTQVETTAAYADILQVSSRNMFNMALLRELGKQRRPVLLERNVSATIEEWLVSAEFILAGGNYDVILCERGIRTFETYTRLTFDISAIPVVKKLSHLPVAADPAHATGRRDKVPALACAAVAAGADVVLIEVHPDPDHALADGAHALYPQQFEELMAQLRMIAPAVGRTL